MSIKPSISVQASRFLIEQDTIFFARLAINPSLETIRSLAMLALIPSISMFAVESSGWFALNGYQPPSNVMQHRSILMRSRQRVKLLEDNRQSISEIMDYASRLLAINKEWFFGSQRGILAPPKRRLQTDLGLYFVDDTLFNTTHVAFLNLGVSPEDVAAKKLTQKSLGPFLYQVSEDLGEHLGWVIANLELDLTDLAQASWDTDNRVGFRDIKSEQFYSDISNRISPGLPAIGSVLISILSIINTAVTLVPWVGAENNWAVFKQKFIALYHASRNLQRILALNIEQAFLKPDAVRILSDMLATASIRHIRKQTELRNNLVHYGLKSHVSNQLATELPMFGIVEASTRGKTLAELGSDVDHGLNVLATALSQLLVPGYKMQESF